MSSSDDKQLPLLKHQQSEETTQQYKLQPKDGRMAQCMTTPTGRKTNLHELRNSEYVSRLMAATPPYLYSAVVGPNNFFFSDMLRSLVQARSTENVRNLQMQQTIISKRSRKRSWSQHRPYLDHVKERRELDVCKAQPAIDSGCNLNAEKPLELTNKLSYFQEFSTKQRKTETESLKCTTEGKLPTTQSIPAMTAKTATAVASNSALEGDGQVYSRAEGTIDNVQETPPPNSLPDLVPSTAPMWYPPHLYPGYGIDPLHFFIDLRVSGHIYDRKKESLSPLASVDSNSNHPPHSNETDAMLEADASPLETPLQQPHKYRQGSAFSVPVSRLNSEVKTNGNAPSGAMNLTSKFDNYTRYYDFGESKENQPSTTGLVAAAKSNASYMLQQLPRLYSQFAAVANGQAIAGANETSNSDNKSEPECDADSNDVGTSAIVLETEEKREHEIDVELIDSIKYHRALDVNGGDSSRCTSPDDGSITHID